MTTAMVVTSPRTTMRERLFRIWTQGPGATIEAKPLNLSHSYKQRPGTIVVLINPERERKLTESLREAQAKHDKAVDQAFEKRTRAKAVAKAAYDKAMASAIFDCNQAVAGARREFERFEQEQLRLFSLPPSAADVGATAQ